MTLSPDGPDAGPGARRRDGRPRRRRDAAPPRRRSQALRGYVGALAFSRTDGCWWPPASAGRRRSGTPEACGRPERARDADDLQSLAFSPTASASPWPRWASPRRTAARPSRAGSSGCGTFRRRVVVRAMPPTAAASIAFSKDGRLLAAIGATEPTEIREAGTGRLVARLRTFDHSRSVAFSPNGRLVATGHYDGTAQLWSTADWKPVGSPLEGHDRRRFFSLEFSPDGSVLVTAGQDGTVALWDVASQAPIGSPLLVEADGYLAADLSDDGSYLFVATAKRRAMRWTVDPAAWKQQACRVAGRELTAQEWREALPRQPFRRVCGGG